MFNNKMMANWTYLVGVIKDKWGELTDQELDQVRGEKDKLVSLIEEKYGESKDIIEQKLTEMMNNDKVDGGQLFQQTAEAVLKNKDEIVEFTSNLSNMAKNYAKENPVSAMLWGFGVGYVIGKLMRRG